MSRNLGTGLHPAVTRDITEEAIGLALLDIGHESTHVSIEFTLTQALLTHQASCDATSPPPASFDGLATSESESAAAAQPPVPL